MYTYIHTHRSLLIAILLYLLRTPVIRLYTSNETIAQVARSLFGPNSPKSVYGDFIQQ